MKFEWNPKFLGWKYLNYILIAVALIVGLGVWWMPNKWAEPETAAKWAKQKEYLRAAREAKAAAEEQKRMEDELGLIYIDPGTNPFPTEPPAKDKTADSKEK